MYLMCNRPCPTALMQWASKRNNQSIDSEANYVQQLWYRLPNKQLNNTLKYTPDYTSGPIFVDSPFTSV